MKTMCRLTGITTLLAAYNLCAATLIVGPGGYYTIQQAVDAASAGDLIQVTNGFYSGFTADKQVRVQSMNGAQFTTIEGTVTLGSGARLSGFTVMHGDPVVRCWAAATNAFLTNCVISGGYVPGGNGVDGIGGGVFGCTLYYCLLTDNWASYGGSGAALSTLYNCTVAGNSASIISDGGVLNRTLYNCIVCFNPPGSPDEPNGGPLFVDYTNGNFRLQSNSPCINAGINAYVNNTRPFGPKDLDGRARISGGTVDLGAYEFQNPASIISYAWLQQYGLPTDGSADFTDGDYDGMNNWKEWICWTCPTNAESVLRLLRATPTPTNVNVEWQSVGTVSYLVERSANLSSPFMLLATNIPGRAGTTSYRDTNAVGPEPFFYRVGVRAP